MTELVEIPNRRQATSPPLGSNRVIQRILGTYDRTTDESSDSSDASSTMSTKTSSNAFDVDELITKMEQNMPGSTHTIKGKKDYAQVMRFRHTLRDTLAEITCPHHDCGYSWLVDTIEAHRDRMGDNNAIQPVMPDRPVNPGASASTELRRQYKTDKKHYLNCADI